MDLDRFTLRVSRQLQWVRARGAATVPALVEPKSASSRRTLPLAPVTVEALRDHRARWRDERLALGRRWLNEWDLVFVGEHGEPINPRALCDELDAILKGAGLPDIRFHDLRHTCATEMRRRGVDIKVVQETLGHSDPSLTLRTYSHVTPDLRGLGVAAQSAILGG